MSESAAFLPLFLAHQSDLRAFLAAVVRDAAMREDIFQNVSLTLWEKFAEFDDTRSFGAWARGIAAKKVLHEHRSRERFPLTFPPETLQAVVDAWDRTELPMPPREAALRECMAELPEKSRLLVKLRYEEELSGEIIATRTGSSVDAVYQNLTRLRQALGECIRRRLGLRPNRE